MEVIIEAKDRKANYNLTSFREKYNEEQRINRNTVKRFVALPREEKLKELKNSNKAKRTRNCYI